MTPNRRRRRFRTCRLSIPRYLELGGGRAFSFKPDDPSSRILYSSQKNRTFHYAWRQAISFAVLFCVLLAALPIPVGWKPKVRSGAVPFPCQDCHCGCSTPEQCWTSCCCFTPQERLAWAIEHDVEPPSYAVLGGVPNADTGANAVTAKSCCDQKASCSEDTVRLAVVETKHSCCQTCDSIDGDDIGATCTSSATDDQETIVVLSINAIKCQGGNTRFCHLPWAIVDLCGFDLFYPEPPFTPYEVSNDWLPSAALRPAIPPPRQICVSA